METDHQTLAANSSPSTLSTSNVLISFSVFPTNVCRSGRPGVLTAFSSSSLVVPDADEASLLVAIISALPGTGFLLGLVPAPPGTGFLANTGSGGLVSGAPLAVTGVRAESGRWRWRFWWLWLAA